MDTEPTLPPEIRDTAAPHPEEMKVSVDLAVGSRVRFTASARATPAGLIAAALLTTSVLVSAGWLARAVLRQGRFGKIAGQ